MPIEKVINGSFFLSIFLYTGTFFDFIKKMLFVHNAFLKRMFLLVVNGLTFLVGKQISIWWTKKVDLIRTGFFRGNVGKKQCIIFHFFREPLNIF